MLTTKWGNDRGRFENGSASKKKKSKMQYGIPKKDPVGVKPNKLL
jgi:hypothetical protein